MVLPDRRFGPIAIALVLSLGGCGGTVKSAPGAAGSTAGGATGEGGSGATASGSGGMSMSVGGEPPVIAGSGGAPASDICSLAWDGGPCDAAMPRYWHNPQTGHCEMRIYGGCAGNENRFDSLASCIAACHTGEDPNIACNQASDCELRSPGCCGACEPIAASDLVAVNHAAPTTTCNVNCGACPSPVPNETTSRYFIPGCVEHQCTVVDIRETSITECTTSSDCALRNTAGCCERCGIEQEPIAYNKSVNPVAAFCGGTPTPCPACVGGVPTGFLTDCVAGRCIVEVVSK